MIRVLANEIAREAYLNNEDPQPVGSILIKEGYTGSDCDESSLSQWWALRKEALGFDPQDGDRHWQLVLRTERLVFVDRKTNCVGCHSASECLTRDRMCTPP